MSFPGSSYRKGQRPPPPPNLTPQYADPQVGNRPPAGRGPPSEYVCLTCGVDHYNPDRLMAHMEKTQHGTWFYCTLCTWSFVTERLLLEHITQQHPPGSLEKHRQGEQQSRANVKRAPLSEGNQLNNDAKKDYDRIVRSFVEDENIFELEFPSTLTAQERHHVHKLAMHFFLEHKSYGPDNDRRLKLTKKNAPRAGAGAASSSALSSIIAAKARVKTVDGYQGAQPLGDAFLGDHVDTAASLLAPMSSKMMHKLRSEAFGAGRRTHVRRFHAADGALGKPPAKPKVDPQEAATFAAFRERLPAYAERDRLIGSVRKNNVTIVCGETGCGKTTQIPQMLFDAGLFPRENQIICTQPRRISALSVANRVAQERAEQCGDSCGYIIRFENQTSSATRIVYVTTGILLRRLHTDPELAGVSCVILDEVHERDVDTDFSLLLLRDLVSRRQEPLKLVVMSATIQIERLVKYFASSNGTNPPTSIHIRGTLFPVEEYFLDEALNWLGLPASAAPAMLLQQEIEKNEREASLRGSKEHATAYDRIKSTAISEIDMDQEVVIPYQVIMGLIEHFHTQNRADRTGSILVFLPGWGPMDRIGGLIRRSQYVKELSVFFLHSSITAQEQARVFYPPPRGFRKVILATNVAETSITIDDVTFVIDSGLAKGTAYDAAGNTSSLKSQLIAKANGIQRRGRAGRCKPGVCVHLLPRRAYDRLPDFLPPEMMRSSLEEICLQIKAIKDEPCVDVLSKAMDPPSRQSIEHAVTFLTELGAFDGKERLTHLGRALATLPLHPQLGKMLFVATVLGVLEPVSIIAAALASKSPFVKPLPHQVAESKAIQDGFDQGDCSDHLTVLRLFYGWRQSNCSDDYAHRNMANPANLRAINRTKLQLERLILHSGFLKKVSGDAAAFAGRNSTNTGLIRLTLLWSLYPRVATLERHRTRSKPEPFCWDNKPTQFHPSTVAFKKRSEDVRGSEFFVFYERMRIESVLNIFDVTAVTRTMMTLCVRSLACFPLSACPSAVIVDDESKFGPFDGSTSAVVDAASPAATNQSVLILEDDARKVFVAPTPVALLLQQLREAMDFYFHLSVRAVDASLFPDTLVRAIGYGIGYPIQQQQPAHQPNSNSASSLRAATSPSGSVVPQWSCAFSDDEADGAAPEPSIEMIPLTEDAINRVQDTFGDLAILDRAKFRAPVSAGPANDEIVVPAAVAPASEARAPFVDPAILSAFVAAPFSPTTEAIEQAAVCFARDMDDADGDDEDEDDVVVLQCGMDLHSSA